MTRLESAKPVKRIANIALDHRVLHRDQDDVIVTLYPHGFIGFRRKRCKQEHIVTLAYCYAGAVKASLAADRAAKKAAAR